MYKRYLLYSFLFLLLIYFENASASLKENSNTIFNWAEQQYPQYFSPGGQNTQKWDVWYYRFYPDTGIYIGVNEQAQVHVLGGEFGATPLFIATVSDFLPLINSNNNNSENSLFTNVDSVLNQKNVSTNSPEGLWLIYSQGSSDYFGDFGTSSLNRKSTHNLFAFVASVYLIEELGKVQLVISGCSGSYSGNNLLVDNAVHIGTKINQFPITLDRLWIISDSTLFPYKAGDLTSFNDSNFKEYMEKEINVTLIDNREMLFDSDFTYIDKEGDIQGNFTATFKGRKISDNIMTDLGLFKVNDYISNSHCFAYSNTSELNRAQDIINNATFITQNDFTVEQISVASYPRQANGISYMLYQKRGEFTSVVNGQPYPAEELLSLSLGYTSVTSEAPFDGASVLNSIATDILDINIDLAADFGLIIDYSISNTGNSGLLSGTIEAKL